MTITYSNFFNGAFFGGGFFGAGVQSGDTHDGFDEETRRKVKQKVRAEEKAFKSRRELLRETIERAWDGPQPEPALEPVAAQVREIAAPYVERLESGGLRIDYEGARRVQKEILALQAALRREFAERMERENDDEDVMIVAALWN